MGIQLPSQKGAEPPIFGPYLLWPNGWMDQDATWHGGRPQPKRHCVRWGPSSPPPRGGAPQFLANICCGQMAGWIKMPLGREVRPQSKQHCVRWGPSSPSQKGGGALNFQPMSIVAKRLDGLDATWYGGRPWSRRLCVRWGPSSPQKKGHSPHPIFGPCLLWLNGWMAQDATWKGGRPQPR